MLQLQMCLAVKLEITTFKKTKFTFSSHFWRVFKVALVVETYFPEPAANERTELTWWNGSKFEDYEKVNYFHRNRLKSKTRSTCHLSTKCRALRNY